MSKSAHVLIFCRLFSYTISLDSLGEALLFFLFLWGSVNVNKQFGAQTACAFMGLVCLCTSYMRTQDTLSFLK